MFAGVSRAVQSVIGTIIAHPELIDDVKVKFKPVDVYEPTLRALYQALIDLDDRRIGVDRATVESRMGDHLSDELWFSVTSAADYSMFEDHLHVIGDDILRRKLQKVCADTMTSHAENRSLSADVLLARHSNAITALSSDAASGRDAASFKDLMPQFILDLKAKAVSGNRLSGKSTGFSELDELTSGFNPGDLVVLAARPSMGKTALSMNISESFAARGDRTLIFSMEMPKEQLLMRSIASVGSIDLKNLKTGQLTELELGRFSEAVDRLNTYSILIDDTQALTVSQLRLKAIKAHRESPVSMIMIDYLTLMSFADINADSKSDKIGHVTRQLKMLASELNCVIVLLSQLNRELERRPDKRPINSDLRDSGSIEQDADLILFVYRDEVYNEDSPDKGMAEIIIGKQRNGSLGTARVKFEGRYARFAPAPRITQMPKVDPGLNASRESKMSEANFANSNDLLHVM